MKELKKKLIPENPTEFIQIKNISGGSQTKRELTDHEIYWFFKELNEYKPNEVLFFELLNAIGARVGEIASLKWSDVLQDFTIISICSTYIEYYVPSINSKVETINSPKRKASKRVVLIPDYLGNGIANCETQLIMCM